MKRIVLLLASVVAAFIGTAHAQAVAPLAPSPPPVAEPAPSFPQPSFTPSGAGASHGGLAAPSPELPPRSEGRILQRDPKFGGPELWSADSPSAVVNNRPATVGGVQVPFAPGARTEAEKRDIRQCATTLNDALRGTAQWEAMAALPPDMRKCLAARLLKHCTSVKRRNAKSKFEGDKSRAEKSYELRIKADDAAADFERRSCEGLSLPATALEIFNTVVPDWDHKYEGFDAWEAKATLN